MIRHTKSLTFAVGLASLVSFSSSATVVEVQTVLGTVEINLYDTHTPETVANFLSYVNAGAYANTIVHRTEPGFVVQSGGFVYNNEFPLDAVAVGSPVVNEPKLANKRGTIAMAKLSNQPDSATSQWFINMSDNASLDAQNGGFTVFGQVLGDGMDVFEAIGELKRFNFGGAFLSMPLRDFTTEDANNDVDIEEENLVLIHDIIVINAEVETHPELIPVLNTQDPDDGFSGSSSSGGSMAWLLLPAFALGLVRRLRLK